MRRKRRFHLGTTETLLEFGRMMSFNKLRTRKVGTVTLLFAATGLTLAISGANCAAAAPGSQSARGTQTSSAALPTAQPSTGTRRVIFASDWSTATGSSDAARRDLGKAVPWGGYGGVREAVD